MTLERERALVLIVDDDPLNRSVLKKMVNALGHDAISAPDGPGALARVENHLPDLVLLDISMPGMDGYEVLDRLRQSGRLPDLPVVMISALEETENTARCLRAGAEDYLAKPFQMELMAARLSACLRRKQINELRARHRDELEAKVHERTRELEEARRRLALLDQTKGEFLQLISHVLRTPVSGLLGVTEVLLEEDLDPLTRSEMAEVFRNARERLVGILDQALLLTQVQVAGAEVEAREVPLGEALALADSAGRTAAERRGARWVMDASAPEAMSLTVMAEPVLLGHALKALAEVAVAFSVAPGPARLSARATAESVRVLFQSSGPAAAPNDLGRLWEAFQTGFPDDRARDLGLGPPLARRVVELFGGAIEWENAPEGPAFVVVLPRPAPKPKGLD